MYLGHLVRSSPPRSRYKWNEPWQYTRMTPMGKERHGLKERSGKWNLTAELKDTGSTGSSVSVSHKKETWSKEWARSRTPPKTLQKISVILCPPHRKKFLMSRTKLITRLSFWLAAHRWTKPRALPTYEKGAGHGNWECVREKQTLRFVPA